ncbi:tRNA pseudouridine(38-40) synthase [Sphaceloma murrayae]|uniref:tRNA pseudouridine synthase 1 n=1 Tax=Sphaceloma murrayae TaxID=2082308 RepID=A0A2K1QWM4_9PEZI|nr:tRNA pseudouridine(38-40) synthase [Sphaceloma murrayae]
MAVEDDSNIAPAADTQNEAHMAKDQSPDIEGGSGQNGDRKRKRFQDDHGKSGSRGKRRDMGRKDWQRDDTRMDKRSRNEREKIKRKDDKPSVLPAGFAQDEIAAEDRRPKKKVAVLIGYSGTGYRGMQISPTEKTIEGELFTAFVKAGAISKANADDPKKSSLVRCARTDKGVHAAGNMISLKLITEDENIVEKINEALPAQIRVWGIERTIGSFSCYQSCDSRWYEYLIPSHAFLPPHPSSFLGKISAEYAKEEADEEAMAARQIGVEGFWAGVEEHQIKPILNDLDDEIRELVVKALFPRWDGDLLDAAQGDDSYVRQLADIGSEAKGPKKVVQKGKRNDDEDREEDPTEEEIAPPTEESTRDEQQTTKLSPEKRELLFQATKRLKAAYDAARRSYRIDQARIKLIQGALDTYIGTRNYHNYTIQKAHTDPSAKRNIKSFVANPEPILINGTEWLSLKVHGQSFMMHQIRKMVGMVTLLVRAGADAPKRIEESYGRDRWSIPKVPGLGLLLERPVFDSYNTNQAAKFGRELLDFGKFEDKIEAFKRTNIYERIWEEEKSSNTFHQFFNHIDNYNQPHFLYLTSKGFAATKIPLVRKGEVAPAAGVAASEAAQDVDQQAAAADTSGVKKRAEPEEEAHTETKTG